MTLETEGLGKEEKKKERVFKIFNTFKRIGGKNWQIVLLAERKKRERKSPGREVFKHV